MDERLAKRWKVTESLLRDAATEIQSGSEFAQFEHFLSHNELELALFELSQAGEKGSVSSDFWRLLKQAAAVMGLHEERKRYMRLYQTARRAE